jgi:hypothetical protein
MDTHDDGRVPDITLERYRLNELPPEAAARLDRQLQRDPGLRQRLEALGASDAEIHASGRLELLASRVQRQLEERGAAANHHRGQPFRLWLPPAVAAMVVVLLLALPRSSTVPNEDGERIKGLQPSLTLFRRMDGTSETLADGAVAHTGDLIRLGYHAAGQSYGVIVSIDGRRHVTLHLPRTGERAVPLGREATVLLDHAYELDDAPRWERFYFVTGNEPFPVSAVVAPAERAALVSRDDKPATLALPAGLTQSVFSLQKEIQP